MFTKKYIEESINILNKIEIDKLEKIISVIASVRKKQGRIFFLVVGGSAANASHAVNDFRKLACIESYAPTDNVSELTARINDEGWNSSFSNWLKISNLNSKDALFVLSVGGGNIKKKVSVNIIEAIKYAKIKKAKIFGIVGRDGGYTKKQGDNVIVIPNINKKNVTPYTEAYQAVIWHSIISHSILKSNLTKW